MKKLWHKQRGGDTAHTAIPTKFQNYPSTTILKHANIFAEVNKSHHVHILKRKPCNKCALLKAIYAQ